MQRKTGLAAAFAAVALALTTVGATAAMADTPTPTPTRTINPTPTFTHTVRPTPTPTETVTTPPPVVNPQTCTSRPITFTPTRTPTDQPSVDQGLPTPTYTHTVRPTPTPTETVTQPPVVNPQQCTPESFVAQLTAVGNVVVQNRVIASGPVFGTGSDDLGVQTNTFSRFMLPGLLRRVNVLHTGISFPSENLALCVATVNQLGVWRFNGGPAGSVFRNSIGNGTFLLTGQWVFPTIRGVCSLSLISGNPLLQNRINPRYTSVQVWATGLARR